MLDLDALVHGAFLTGAIDRTAAHLGREPHTIVDLGAGTGTGTLALARRFPGADLVAVDNSPRMLGRVRDAATEAGLAARIRTVEADLDTRWPDVGTVDLIWAALSLHHIAEPEPLLRTARSALAPDGLLVVVEMDGLPTFLPDDTGSGAPGLEHRCHALARRNGWNEHPNWHEPLATAGFDVLDERPFDVRLDPAPDGTAAYAQLMLARMRAAIAAELDPDDLAALDRLLDERDPESLRRRDDLIVRGGRTVWTARPAQQRHSPKRKATTP